MGEPISIRGPTGGSGLGSITGEDIALGLKRFFYPPQRPKTAGYEDPDASQSVPDAGQSAAVVGEPWSLQTAPAAVPSQAAAPMVSVPVEQPPRVLARIPASTVTVPGPTQMVQDVMSPEAMQAARDAIKQEKEYNELQAQHLGEQVKSYEQQVKFAQDSAAVDEAAQARSMQITEQKNQAVASDLQKYEQARDAFAKSTPRSYWGKLDTGNKILAAISLGLGAFGAAMARTPNYAMQIIQSKIDDDLEQQRAARDLAGANVAELKGAIGITAKLYDDKLLQNEAAAAMSYRQLERQLGIMSLKYQGTDAGNRAEEMKAQAGVIAAQKEAQLQAASTARVSQSFATQTMPGRTVTTQDVTGMQAKEQGLLDWRDVAKDKAQLARYVKFAGAVANSDEDYKQLVKDHTAVQSMRGLINELIAFKRKHGEVIDLSQLSHEDRARAGVLATRLKSKIADKESLPLRSERSWSMLEELAPDPTKFISHAIPEYQAMLDSLNADEQINVEERSTKVVNIPSGRRAGNQGTAGPTASTFRPVGAE